MTAGSLDQRITFQEGIETSDGAGGISTSWADIVTVPKVWARVWPKSARELTEEGRINAVGLYAFKIRNRSDISEKHRIIWGGENYNIRAVRRSGDRVGYLFIDAERGSAS